MQGADSALTGMMERVLYSTLTCGLNTILEGWGANGSNSLLGGGLDLSECLNCSTTGTNVCSCVRWAG